MSVPVGLTVAGATIAGLAAISILGARRIGAYHLARQCAATRSLCLTFDDGPGPRTTPAVLDRLAGANAPATFFLLGQRVEGASAIADRIRREGHEIACHTECHLNAWRASPWRVAADVAAGYRILAPWMPSDGLFRPPYGRVTPFTWLSVRRRGARIGWWTIDSGDTREHLPSPQSVADRVSRSGGGVVLLHDFDRATHDAPSRMDFVCRTTELLLRTAQVEGMAIRPLGRLLGTASPVVKLAAGTGRLSAG